MQTEFVKCVFTYYLYRCETSHPTAKFLREGKILNPLPSPLRRRGNKLYPLPNPPRSRRDEINIAMIL